MKTPTSRESLRFSSQRMSSGRAALSLVSGLVFGLAFGLTLTATLALPVPAFAEEQKPPPAQQPRSGEAPALSEIPTMKEQGERMATLMERLSKESDPAERKRIMAEAICPQ